MTSVEVHPAPACPDQCVLSILLQRCECWTLAQAWQTSLDGCDTRRTGLDTSQDEDMTYELMTSPSVVEKIAVGRMRLAGHCHQHSEPPAKTAGTHLPLLTYERKILVEECTEEPPR